jgi:hypothetical protein
MFSNFTLQGLARVFEINYSVARSGGLLLGTCQEEFIFVATSTYVEANLCLISFTSDLSLAR